MDAEFIQTQDQEQERLDRDETARRKEHNRRTLIKSLADVDDTIPYAQWSKERSGLDSAMELIEAEIPREAKGNRRQYVRAAQVHYENDITKWVDGLEDLTSHVERVVKLSLSTPDDRNDGDENRLANPNILMFLGKNTVKLPVGRLHALEKQYGVNLRHEMIRRQALRRGNHSRGWARTVSVVKNVTFYATVAGMHCAGNFFIEASSESLDGFPIVQAMRSAVAQNTLLERLLVSNMLGFAFDATTLVSIVLHAPFRPPAQTVRETSKLVSKQVAMIMPMYLVGSGGILGAILVRALVNTAMIGLDKGVDVLIDNFIVYTPRDEDLERIMIEQEALKAMKREHKLQSLMGQIDKMGEIQRKEEEFRKRFPKVSAAKESFRDAWKYISSFGVINKVTQFLKGNALMVASMAIGITVASHYGLDLGYSSIFSYLNPGGFAHGMFEHMVNGFLRSMALPYMAKQMAKWARIIMLYIFSTLGLESIARRVNRAVEERLSFMVGREVAIGEHVVEFSAMFYQQMVGAAAVETGRFVSYRKIMDRWGKLDFQHMLRAARAVVEQTDASWDTTRTVHIGNVSSMGIHLPMPLQVKNIHLSKLLDPSYMIPAMNVYTQGAQVGDILYAGSNRYEYVAKDKVRNLNSGEDMEWSDFIMSPDADNVHVDLAQRGTVPVDVIKTGDHLIDTISGKHYVVGRDNKPLPEVANWRKVTDKLNVYNAPLRAPVVFHDHAGEILQISDEDMELINKYYGQHEPMKDILTKLTRETLHNRRVLEKTMNDAQEIKLMYKRETLRFKEAEKHFFDHDKTIDERVEENQFKEQMASLQFGKMLDPKALDRSVIDLAKELDAFRMTDYPRSAQHGPDHLQSLAQAVVAQRRSLRDKIYAHASNEFKMGGTSREQIGLLMKKKLKDANPSSTEAAKIESYKNILKSDQAFQDSYRQFISELHKTRTRYNERELRTINESIEKTETAINKDLDEVLGTLREQDELVEKGGQSITGMLAHMQTSADKAVGNMRQSVDATKNTVAGTKIRAFERANRSGARAEQQRYAQYEQARQKREALYEKQKTQARWLDMQLKHQQLTDLQQRTIMEFQNMVETITDQDVRQHSILDLTLTADLAKLLKSGQMVNQDQLDQMDKLLEKQNIVKEKLKVQKTQQDYAECEKIYDKVAFGQGENVNQLVYTDTNEPLSEETKKKCFKETYLSTIGSVVLTAILYLPDKACRRIIDATLTTVVPGYQVFKTLRRSNRIKGSGGFGSGFIKMPVGAPVPPVFSHPEAYICDAVMGGAGPVLLASILGALKVMSAKCENRSQCYGMQEASCKAMWQCSYSNGDCDPALSESSCLLNNIFKGMLCKAKPFKLGEIAMKKDWRSRAFGVFKAATESGTGFEYGLPDSWRRAICGKPADNLYQKNEVFASMLRQNTAGIADLLELMEKISSGEQVFTLDTVTEVYQTFMAVMDGPGRDILVTIVFGRKYSAARKDWDLLAAERGFLSMNVAIAAYFKDLAVSLGAGAAYKTLQPFGYWLGFFGLDLTKLSREAQKMEEMTPSMSDLGVDEPKVQQEPDSWWSGWFKEGTQKEEEATKGVKEEEEVTKSWWSGWF